MYRFNIKLMAKLNQTGSVHLIAIGVVVISLVSATGYYVISKNKESTKNSTAAVNSAEQTEKKLEIQNLGLQNIEDVEVTKNALRDYASNGLKGFYVFGEKLSGNRLNPTLEYASMKKESNIVSAIDGVVAFIKNQSETNDYEVFIQPKEGSKWTVGYDHIVNLNVEKGQNISAGDSIGNPSIQNNGLYRFEIQINEDSDGNTTHHCPTKLLSKKVEASLTQSLLAMQKSWNSLASTTLYDLDAQSPVGCLSATLTPTQAEGR